jgi:predicted nuclease of predicted toxin-antitoxin system
MATKTEIKFYLDENVAGAVAEGVRTMGIDALTTPEAGKIELSDEEQLAFALSQNRVLITQDTDLLVLHSQKAPHAGIAYYKPQTRTVKQLLRSLRNLHDQSSAEDVHNEVVYL